MVRGRFYLGERFGICLTAKGLYSGPIDLPFGLLELLKKGSVLIQCFVGMGHQGCKILPFALKQPAIVINKEMDFFQLLLSDLLRVDTIFNRGE